MKQAIKRYTLELGGALVCYCLVLTLSIQVVQHGWVSAALRPAVVLTPMIPCAFGAWAIIRQLRRLDELQVRIQLEGLGFAFAGTALLTFAYGFLEGVGYPRLSMFFVWPIMASLWVVGGLLAHRRYR